MRLAASWSSGAMALMAAGVSAQHEGGGRRRGGDRQDPDRVPDGGRHAGRRGDREALRAGRRRDAAERAGGQGARRDRGVPQGVRPAVDDARHDDHARPK